MYVVISTNPQRATIMRKKLQEMVDAGRLDPHSWVCSHEKRIVFKRVLGADPFRGLLVVTDHHGIPPAQVHTLRRDQRVAPNLTMVMAFGHDCDLSWAHQNYCQLVLSGKMEKLVEVLLAEPPEDWARVEEWLSRPEVAPYGLQRAVSPADALFMIDQAMMPDGQNK